MNHKGKQDTFIQQQKSDIPISKITIKLIGDPHRLTEIVSDINQQYRTDTKCNDQESLQTNSKSNSEPVNKRLKIKEELLSQRVVLVLPNNSSTHYLPSSLNQNELVCNENQSENVSSYFHLEDLKVKSEQKNNKSWIQNSVDDKSENTNSESTKQSDSNETCEEDIENYIREHKRLHHNHEAKNTQLKQMINSEYSSKLNEKKSPSSEPIVDGHKLQLIKKPFEFKNFLISPIQRKLAITESFSRSYGLKRNRKNGVKSISDNNLAKNEYLLNKSISMHTLHSPIVLQKNHSMNHFNQNKFLNIKQKVISHTVSKNDETVEDKISPSRSPSNLTGTTNFLADSKLVNSAIINQSFENKTTVNSLFRPKDSDVRLNQLERNKTYLQSSSQQNTNITVKDQEQSSKNTEIDVQSHNYSLNSNISELITKSNSQNPQKTIPLVTTSNKTSQIILDNKGKNVTQESNNYKCTNRLKTPERRKDVSLGNNKIPHHINNEKQHIKSPQIKINGLTIRAPDPHLLNNLSLQEKIQKFRLSNKSCGKTDQHNNSGTLSEVSESLVSTTTVESSQPDKQIRDCQCNQLRREVNEQWGIITGLRSRVKLSLKDSGTKCDSLAEEKSQLEDEKYISSMLLKELEETNIKISENLRKEQIRNKKLKLTLKYRRTRIKELELRLKTISKIFEETEKSALSLRDSLQL